MLDTIFKAIPEKIENELANLSANYLHRSVKFEKGESSTTHAI